MNSGSYTAVSGAVAAQLKVDMLANNLANINTAGFKKERSSFTAVLADTVAAASAADPRADYPGLIDVSSATDFTQGVLRETGNPLDLALEGKGFLTVQSDKGIAYTRGGTMHVDGSGKLVTAGGQAVLAGGQPLLLPSGKVSVGSDGTVSVDGVTAGRLDVADFPDYSSLVKSGDGLYFPKTGVSPRQGEAVVRSGAQEGSNVNAVEEMVHMIDANRFYDATIKVLQSYDDLNSKVTDLGKL